MEESVAKKSLSSLDQAEKVGASIAKIANQLKKKAEAILAKNGYTDITVNFTADFVQKSKEETENENKSLNS
jgi:hypothetical protein